MAAALTNQSLVFSACSLFMSSLFAYSAAVQLDDPDWYFWFPLYALAFGVNLLQVSTTPKRLREVAVLSIWSGLFLFIKVVIEAHTKGLASVWSLDMRERVVREKIGSMLVVISMFLHLKSSEASKEAIKRKREQARRLIESGMTILVASSFGLSMYFFAFVKQEMKF